MSGWETRIATGNPQADQATVEQHRQAATAQGLAFEAQPMPQGGYHVRAFPRQDGPPQGGYPQGGYGQQQGAPPMGGYGQQRGGYAPQASAYGPPQGGAPAYAGAGGATYASSTTSGGVVVGGAAAAPALTNERIQYLRKVYSLLLASVVIAGLAGLAATSLGPTEMMRTPEGHRVAVPVLVAFLLSSRVAMYMAFGLLFVGTIAASAVSKVRGLNLVALFGVAALMGVEVAPMVFVAQFYAGLGKTMSAAPVSGAFLMTAAVFAGATSYVMITRKDFSYLTATLSMGFWIVFAGCIVGAFISSEVFTLAIASVGAIIAAGFLLVQTSRIFRNSAMDDAVGDCLALLVQLRNLFVFILRILMSNRR
jgi:modulator of FtsH protease